ncbi:hypothetical protein B0P06_006127 [Clostridium saccharoperbutylacetonicum]|uniref:Big-1 domain-containing protein n=2 Tax=Clostridium TaxID=1485 RepID=M1MP10_9CLOT|nr:Ig-like domain-containing protein [Clostridium saccharoperbutylacetonicum]AGF59599.1 hypothetical protein Cspa_135p00390 [Clostridium saccharoperbutylacetonicum N1-4(HMT)]NRT64544.1 hypothetical protein [Clostridium saccharoperbutylacetonicum]NSB29020.1 hypothetical protein [Clostridium saccharoperbutylacetonicum]NSB46234.1 hypothetical protein [Clostridium saccharoperbutylacetonicum]
MVIEKFQYKITITIENLVMNSLVDLSKTITKQNIDLSSTEPVQLEKHNLIDYFSREIGRFCARNTISQKDLALYGYEITSNTDGIEVYFNTDDTNVFSPEPAIMAKLSATKVQPVLKCVQLYNNVVKWYWEASEEIKYLKDEHDNIIYQVPSGIGYYIEGDLKTGATYTRYISAVNSALEKLQSLPCSITLLEQAEESTYPVFEVEDRDETICEINKDYPSKLKAFASGVGDDNDCLLCKASDLSLNHKFKLYNKIYGIRASNDIKHHAIKFKYRFKLVGEVPYLGYNAAFTVRVTAQECNNILADSKGEMLYGQPMVSKKNLTYTLDDKVQVAEIYLYQFFPKLLVENYKKRYKFTIEIFNTSGEAVVYSPAYGGRAIKNNNSFSWSEHGYFDHMFTVGAKATKLTKEYVEWYPTKDYDPLTGVINGDFESSKDGLKNLHVNMNTFDTSKSVINKKYYCVFETISPDSGYVQFKWDNPVKDHDYTQVDGDGITFYSDSIFADDSEHSEFITQTEVGPYVIEDNRDHKYTYTISGISVDLAAYKRFELRIVPSINDILIISNIPDLIIKEDGSIDTTVTVTCRNLQSATAKWSPSIHNGYYYYNQNEYFLYSKCVPDDQNLIEEDLYLTKDVQVKLEIGVQGEKKENKKYTYHLSTKEDLLLDSYHYEWADDMVWPKAIESYNDYYREYAPYYEYYTKPFVFNDKVTHYSKITWDEAGTPNSTIEVYAYAYDEINGVYNSPVRIYRDKEIPKELQLSRTLILKFVLKPSRKPKLRKRTLLYDCEADWRNHMNFYLSYNVSYNEEILMPMSYSVDGAYVGTFMDLGDTAEEIKERSIEFNPVYQGEIEIYMVQADHKNDIQGNVKYFDWQKVDINTVKTDLKRFIRYMIILKPNSKIFYMEMKVQRYEYTDEERKDYLPGFGNIYVEALSYYDYYLFHHNNISIYPGETHISETSPTCSVCGLDASTCTLVEHIVTTDEAKYEYVFTHSLKYDAKDELLISDLNGDLTHLSTALGFNVGNVVNTNFYPYGDISDFSISKVGNEVYIKSDDILYDEQLIENNQAGATYRITDNTITLSPIPQQYAPIIIYCDERDAAYTQVFFTDENYNYVLTNTEEFESLGFKTLYLKYLNIDIKSLKVEIDYKQYLQYTIKDNVIIFNEKIKKGTHIKVAYKLLYSFAVNYDYSKDTFKIDFNKETGEKAENIKIFYETNKISACRELSDISFNPIYSARYNGYVFICDYVDEPRSVTIYPSSDYIYANGLDTMNTLVQVLDKNSNPIENVKVNIVAAKGSINIRNEKTDSNGIIYCRYTASLENCIDTIKATVSTDVKDEVKIYNRKL